MKKKYKHTAITLTAWIILILAWYLVTRYNLISSTVMASPKEVIDSFVELLKEGYNGISIWTHIYVSLKRLFIAVIIAIITAVPLGLLSGYIPSFRAAVGSFINFYRFIPPLAYYMLLIIWMGIGDSSKVMLLYLAAFAPIYLVCVDSVGDVKKEYILSAMSMGASGRDIFFKVILPATLPRIFTGVRTAVGFAYTTLVSAEIVAAVSGIGWMVLDAQRFFKIDIIFIGIIIMGITGLLIDLIIRKIGDNFIFWKGRQ